MMLPITAFSRVEDIGTITFSQNTSQTLPVNGGLLPNDRFMAGLFLQFRGRLTMPAATGPSAVQADAHAAIIERVTIEGYHRVRKQNERFIDLRGADIELLQRIYQPGVLTKTPTTISVTANATNDMIVDLFIPFTPQRMPVSVQTGYLLDAPNYDSLKLTVQWGDFKSVVVPGASDATWTAYGSASGTPELRVSGQFVIQKAKFAGFVPGRVFRTFTEVIGTIPTTTGTDVRLWDVPRGNDIRAVVMKTGVKATNTTAGNNSFATWTDYLTNIKFNVGLGKYIRNYRDGFAVYADLATVYNLPGRITGINPFDFAQYGTPGEVLNTRPYVNGSSGNTDIYFAATVTGGANQAIVFLTEEWRQRPIFAA